MWYIIESRLLPCLENTLILDNEDNSRQIGLGTRLAWSALSVGHHAGVHNGFGGKYALAPAFFLRANQNAFRQTLLQSGSGNEISTTMT